MVTKTLETIIRIIKRAGDIMMPYYGANPETKFKNVDSASGFNRQDQVTVADEEVDSFIRRELAKNSTYPILSEECPVVPSDYKGNFWCVDPIDGTISFINEMSGFSILIGLADRTGPKLGVVYAPAKEVLFYAESGQGAFKLTEGIESRLQVSSMNNLDNARFVVTNEPTKKKKAYSDIVDKMVGRRVYEGGAGSRMCMVAAGEGDIYVHESDTISKWDTCAAQCIIEAAGGRVTDLFGSSLNYGQEGKSWVKGVAASNGRLHPYLIDKIQEIREKL